MPPHGIVTVEVPGLGPVRVAAAADAGARTARRDRAAPREDPHRDRGARRHAGQPLPRAPCPTSSTWATSPSTRSTSPAARRSRRCSPTRRPGAPSSSRSATRSRSSWPVARRPFHRGLAWRTRARRGGIGKWLVSGPPLAYLIVFFAVADADHGAGVVPHTRRFRRAGAARRAPRRPPRPQPRELRPLLHRVGLRRDLRQVVLVRARRPRCCASCSPTRSRRSSPAARGSTATCCCCS